MTPKRLRNISKSYWLKISTCSRREIYYWITYMYVNQLRNSPAYWKRSCPQQNEKQVRESFHKKRDKCNHFNIIQ